MVQPVEIELGVIDPDSRETNESRNEGLDENGVSSVAEMMVLLPDASDQRAQKPGFHLSRQEKENPDARSERDHQPMAVLTIAGSWVQQRVSLPICQRARDPKTRLLVMSGQVAACCYQRMREDLCSEKIWRCSLLLRRTFRAVVVPPCELSFATFLSAEKRDAQVLGLDELNTSLNVCSSSAFYGRLHLDE